MESCYLITAEDYELLGEVRKYFLVVTCRIQDAIKELGIPKDSLRITLFKQKNLLEYQNIDENIKLFYQRCSSPGVSKLFPSGSTEWSILLKLDLA